MTPKSRRKSCGCRFPAMEMPATGCFDLAQLPQREQTRRSSPWPRLLKGSPIRRGSWSCPARLLPWIAGAAGVLLAAGLYMSASPRRWTTSRGTRPRSCSCTCRRRGWRCSAIRAGRAVELRAAGVSPSAGRRVGQGRRAHRCDLHRSLPPDGHAVGQADVGRVLGVGPAADLGADPVPALPRPDRAALLDRGRGAGRQAHGRARPGRHRHPAGHQVLGGVEQPASAGQRHAAGRADHPSLAAVAAAGDGVRHDRCCSSPCISRPCATRSCAAASRRCARVEVQASAGLAGQPAE